MPRIDNVLRHRAGLRPSLLCGFARVVQHFFSSLQAPGYFFLGHAESLYQVTDQFRLVHLPGTTTYLKGVPGSEGNPKP